MLKVALFSMKGLKPKNEEVYVWDASFYGYQKGKKRHTMRAFHDQTHTGGVGLGGGTVGQI